MSNNKTHKFVQLLYTTDLKVRVTGFVEMEELEPPAQAKGDTDGQIKPESSSEEDEEEKVSVGEENTVTQPKGSIAEKREHQEVQQ